MTKAESVETRLQVCPKELYVSIMFVTLPFHQ